MQTCLTAGTKLLVESPHASYLRGPANTCLEHAWPAMNDMTASNPENDSLMLILSQAMSAVGGLQAQDRSKPNDRTVAARAALKRSGKEATSKLKGVTHHCRTKRYEAHIWEGGKQLYVGGFPSEKQAGLAHDLAAIALRGLNARINYKLEGPVFDECITILRQTAWEKVLAALRELCRSYTGKKPNSSKYRGVARHQKGKWEARIAGIGGGRYKYLGLFANEEDAAIAYDKAAVEKSGSNAVTNFPISNYAELLQSIPLPALAPAEQSTPEVSTPVEPSAAPAVSDVAAAQPRPKRKAKPTRFENEDDSESDIEGTTASSESISDWDKDSDSDQPSQTRAQLLYRHLEKKRAKTNGSENHGDAVSRSATSHQHTTMMATALLVDASATDQATPTLLLPLPPINTSFIVTTGGPMPPLAALPFNAAGCDTPNLMQVPFTLPSISQLPQITLPQLSELQAIDIQAVADAVNGQNGAAPWRQTNLISSPFAIADHQRTPALEMQNDMLPSRPSDILVNMLNHPSAGAGGIVVPPPPRMVAAQLQATVRRAPHPPAPAIPNSGFGIHTQNPRTGVYSLLNDRMQQDHLGSPMNSVGHANMLFSQDSDRQAALVTHPRLRFKYSTGAYTIASILND